MATAMRIRIREPRTNNEAELEVEKEHIISDLIQAVMEHFQLQSGTYFLTREGTVLQNSSSVDGSKIQPGDILILSPDPVGGARLPGPVWETRLLNEEKYVVDNGFYEVDIQDDGPPRTQRTFTVHLSDAPAYQKAGGNAEPVLRESHVLQVKLSRDFPDTHPDVRFLTEIFHPNVFEDQTICIGMLNKWNRSYSVIQLIQAIEQMLWDPGLDPPFANSDAQSVYEEYPLSAPFRPWYSAGGGTISQPPEVEQTDPTRLAEPRIVSRPQVITRPRIVSAPRVVTD